MEGEEERVWEGRKRDLISCQGTGGSSSLSVLDGAKSQKQLDQACGRDIHHIHG